MKALGTHVLAELCECDRAALDDVELIRAAMLEAARRCEATIVADCFHRFSPHGVSGVVVIAESHLAIHTWPEHGYAAVDLFTCGEGLRAEAGLSHLAAALGSRHHTVNMALRGSHPAASAASAHQSASGRAGLTITVINGALGGGAGNTAAIIAPLCSLLRRRARVHEVHLATDARSTMDLEPLLLESDGYVFATGTYWDSWGGPLQGFLEGTTHLESGRAWLGKPAAVVVSMHSVGGKGVLSRLQGVLSTLGCAIPPMSGAVYSLATDLAVRHAPAEAAAFLADFWQLDELQVVCHNLLEAASGGAAWQTWRIDHGDPARRWMPGEAAP